MIQHDAVPINDIAPIPPADQPQIPAPFPARRTADRPDAITADERRRQHRHKRKPARDKPGESYANEPHVFLLPAAAHFAQNPTQLVVLSQIIYWFLSPGSRVDREGYYLRMHFEGDEHDDGTGNRINRDNHSRLLVNPSHRHRRRKKGTTQEYLEERPLDQIKRRAQCRVEIETEDGTLEWRWAVKLPYARWAADTGLSVRQVRDAMKALSTTGWFTLQHNSKREPVVIEGERMRTDEFKHDFLDAQAQGKLPGLLLYARQLNNVCGGDIVAAIVLRQIERLSRRHQRVQVYRTEEQLGQQWNLSRDQIKRAKAKLVRLGVIVVEKAKWVGQRGKRHKASFMTVNRLIFDRLMRYGIEAPQDKKAT